MTQKRNCLAAAAALFCATAFPCATPSRAAEPPLHLTVTFTVSGTGSFDGTYVATLTWAKGAIKGSMTMPADFDGDICTVDSGSTDTKNKLSLTCTEMIVSDHLTFSGKLHVLSGKGHGKFSETFFGDSGTYTAAKP